MDDFFDSCRNDYLNENTQVFLCGSFDESASMPYIRKGGVSSSIPLIQKMSPSTPSEEELNDPTYREMRVLSGVEQIETFDYRKEYIDDPAVAREKLRQYPFGVDYGNEDIWNKKSDEAGGVRKAWLSKRDYGSLNSSGLPKSLEVMLRIQDCDEKEKADYLRIAGIQYKNDKKRLKEKADAVMKIVASIESQLSEKLKDFLTEYKTLQVVE